MRRWQRIALLLGGALAALLLAPIGYIELGCRAPLAVEAGPAAASQLSPDERRPLANTFLTYPEWHIVYEAEAMAEHLVRGGAPSSFAYGTQIGSFWSSYCTLNRASRGQPGAGEAKLMIYTIGISYTAELAVKAAYERTIGRFAEWIGGWHSADDKYAQRVQARYAAFMHETPWYRFPFAQALDGLWRLREPRDHLRHGERRFALSAEYGVKTIYAAIIDKATGATVGRDQPTLRFVTTATPTAIRAIDPRLVPQRALSDNRLVVEAPRYQQFTDLAVAIARADIPLVEIAGNTTIFLTVKLPPGTTNIAPALIEIPLESPGWRRVGMAVPVPELGRVIRQTLAAGGRVEHVYDY